MKCSIFGIVLCLCLCCSAQVVPPKGITKIAERHLKIFYPELAHSTATTYATESWRVIRTWYIWVNSIPKNDPFFVDLLFTPTSTPCSGDPLEHFPHGPCLPRFMPQDNQYPGLLLQAVIYLPSEKSGEYTFYGSTTATSKKNSAFRELLRQHPEWTDEQRATQLTEAGAKFGPNDKAALFSSDTLKRLRVLLGPYHIGRAQFLWYAVYPFSGSSSEPKKADAVFWQIEAVLSRKPHRNYTFIIEPMAGELTQMFHTPAPQQRKVKQPHKTLLSR